MSYIEDPIQATADARAHLRDIASDYPEGTPDEFIVFGRAAGTFTLGELRLCVGLHPSQVKQADTTADKPAKGLDPNTIAPAK